MNIEVGPVPAVFRADAVENQIARDLEQAVAQEEQARGDAVARGANVEFALKVGGDEPDVHAIDVRDEVTEEGEGQEAAPDARHDSPTLGVGFKRQDA